MKDMYGWGEVLAVQDVLERVEGAEGLTRVERSLKGKLDRAVDRQEIGDESVVTLSLTSYEEETFRDVLEAGYQEY